MTRWTTMGRHTASTGKNGNAVASAAATARATEPEEEGPSALRDVWWLAGFFLGILVVGSTAYAAFLWWLTGGLYHFLSRLF